VGDQTDISWYAHSAIETSLKNRQKQTLTSIITWTRQDHTEQRIDCSEAPAPGIERTPVLMSASRPWCTYIYFHLFRVIQTPVLVSP